MKDLQLYELLKDAYESTTKNYNRFKKVIESTKWDNTFSADGEHYFIKDNFTLTIENIDPFKEAWKPTVWIGSDYYKMLNNIEKEILKDLEEMDAETSQYENMKENYINLSSQEKEEYYKQIAAAYNCTEREAKRATNYFAYDCKEIVNN